MILPFKMGFIPKTPQQCDFSWKGSGMTFQEALEQ